MADEKRERVAKPAEEGADKPVSKVLFFNENMEAIGNPPSTQLPDDPFNNRHVRGAQEPPYNPAELVNLTELHPVHGAALEQKSTDIIGTGWQWTLTDPPEAEDGEISEEEMRTLETQMGALEFWFRSLAAPETTMLETLWAWVWDWKTTGQGFLEVGRNKETDEVSKLFHVPSHTCRFHRDGVRIIQIRRGRRVWFKRWGAPTDLEVNRVTGALKPKEEIPEEQLANHMLVIQEPNRRSSWYGIPAYVASIGWIVLAVAARDDNIFFFHNRREPRWVVILKNLADDPDMEEQIRQALTVDHKFPHRNMLLQLLGENADVEFQKLAVDRNDGSFGKLMEQADQQVLVSHRIPPERLGVARVGPLGGNVLMAASQTYAQIVVEPAQAILSSRINRFIGVEFPQGGSGEVDDPTLMPWLWEPLPVDLTSEQNDVEMTTKLFKANVITLNEARERIGEEPFAPDDPRGNLVFDEVAALAGGLPAGGVVRR